MSAKSGGYREAGQMAVEEKEKLGRLAEEICEEMELNHETYREHARYLLLAMQVYADRNPETHDAWRGPGYLGNLLAVYGKILRLMNSLYWVARDQMISRSEKPIDNAMDIINYAVFFARCYDAGEERGGPQSFHREA